MIDDDAELRSSMFALLRAYNAEVRVFRQAEDFLDVLSSLEPGCVIVDICMQPMSGLDLIREMNRRDCFWPIAAITGHGDIPTAVEAVKLGAIEFLQKPWAESELVEILQEGFRLLPERIDRSRQARAARKVLSKLSRREREVFDGVANGRTTKEIAMALKLSPRTVESYRVQVMAKTGAERVQDLWALHAMLPSKT
ncbi:MAG: response regulator [Erythrobacter sp.]|uniref:response regulator transcription factor n=1 Tax=Erythrobacter sp. TaxID=1042 RepID=UPI0025D5CCC3|nr:response regulator [Erythrobacter sp.]MCL9997947.1 response regulator [Erythrobacter sp.]